MSSAVVGSEEAALRKAEAALQLLSTGPSTSNNVAPAKVNGSKGGVGDGPTTGESGAGGKKKSSTLSNAASDRTMGGVGRSGTSLTTRQRSATVSEVPTGGASTPRATTGGGREDAALVASLRHQVGELRTALATSQKNCAKLSTALEVAQKSTSSRARAAAIADATPTAKKQPKLDSAEAAIMSNDSLVKNNPPPPPVESLDYFNDFTQMMFEDCVLTSSTHHRKALLEHREGLLAELMKQAHQLHLAAVREEAHQHSMMGTEAAANPGVATNTPPPKDPTMTLPPMMAHGQQQSADGPQLPFARSVSEQTSATSITVLDTTGAGGGLRRGSSIGGAGKDAEVVLLSMELDARTEQLKAIEDRLTAEREARQTTTAELEVAQDTIIRLNDRLARTEEQAHVLQREVNAHAKLVALQKDAPVKVDIAVQSGSFGDSSQIQKSIKDTISMVGTLQGDIESLRVGPKAEGIERSHNLTEAYDRIAKEVEVLREDRKTLVKIVQAQNKVLETHRKPIMVEKWTQLRVDYPALECLQKARAPTKKRSSHHDNSAPGGGEGGAHSSVETQDTAVGTESSREGLDNGATTIIGGKHSTPRKELVNRLDTVKGYLMTLEKALDSTENVALKQGLVSEIHVLHDELLHPSSPSGGRGNRQFNMH